MAQTRNDRTREPHVSDLAKPLSRAINPLYQDGLAGLPRGKMQARMAKKMAAD
jgi:hypothetical protein